MKTVILIFSHNTLSRCWKKLASGLAEIGIELIVLSQSGSTDWNRFLVEKVSSADVLYLDMTAHCPVYEAILEMALDLPFVLGGSMDVCGVLQEPRSNIAGRFKKYLESASLEDLENGIRYLLYASGNITKEPPLPQVVSLCAIGCPHTQRVFHDITEYLEEITGFGLEKERSGDQTSDAQWIIPLLYGRRYWISGDMGIIAELMECVRGAGFQPVPVYCDFSLGNRLNEHDHPVAQLLLPFKEQIVALLNLAFASSAGKERPDRLFNEIGKPVFQLIRDYSRTQKEWEHSGRSLLGMTYNFSVAQPETLGTIEPHLIACNEVDKNTLPQGETPLAFPVAERINRLMQRVKRWHHLQTCLNEEKRVAIVLHNSPCKGVEATLGTAAGLNSAQSTVDLMNRMHWEGYDVSDIPEDGAALLQLIQERKAHSEFRWTNTETILAKGGVIARINESRYRERFDQLPSTLRRQIDKAWGEFPGKAMVSPENEDEPELLITGLHFGKILVMVEAKRGCWGPKCDGEVCRILHEPDIPPTHHWLATAWYLQDNYDAMIQMGSESSMDYLPGKAVALSHNCFPDLSLGELPRLYPYIMDSIGEGLLAKRRGKGVMVNHLTPPVRVAKEESNVVEQLSELYRQLLHARSNGHENRASELQEILRAEMVENGLLEKVHDDEALEEAFSLLSRRLQQIRTRILEAGKHVLGRVPDEANMRLYLEESNRADAFDEADLRGRLNRVNEEMDHLIQGLDGRFISSGQAGSLSSGRDTLLPTGRNFYSIDLHTIPTKAAWEVGKEMGRKMLQKYLDDEGKFPESIGITLWSSDAFMAEGELTSQCMWLLGCRPIWNAQGKVSGIEVIPKDEMQFLKKDGRSLERPRIDCVVRMSGVVRDLLEPVYLLIDDAVNAVSQLNEPDEGNFVRKHVQARLAELEKDLDQLDNQSLRRLATGRLFTDHDGSYGAGVGLAVDASAWKNEHDLANAYINWTGGLCGREMDTVVSKAGKTRVMEEFGQQMKGIAIAYQRTISSKYDALSISCYTGYQGGMAVTQKALGGKKLKLYWGDSQSGPEAEVRDLEDELDLSLIARLLSQEWIEERMKEGYSGATDLSSLVNTLFSWSATTGMVKKRHFDLVTRKIVADEKVREWLIQENVYALEEITRRLLEAHGRKLWEADEDSLTVLKDATLQLEGDIEDRMGSVSGEFQGSSVDIKTQEEVTEWQWGYRASENADKVKGK